MLELAKLSAVSDDAIGVNAVAAIVLKSVSAKATVPIVVAPAKVPAVREVRPLPLIIALVTERPDKRLSGIEVKA